MSTLNAAPASKKFAYTEITCKSALHRHASRYLPFDYDVNAYRGCTHGCKYCYALYSHKYIEAENYFGNIFIKTNIVEQLERELSAPKWKRETVNLGGVTDSYQKAEAYYKIMPDIWRLLIKYKTPAIISTKSDLILRDFDLVAELASVAKVNIAVTVTTVDYAVQKLIEPGAPDPDRRFSVLMEFNKTKAATGLHLMPIIPYITDSYDNLDSIFDCATRCNVDYLLPGMLNLRGQTRISFFEFLAKKMPELQRKFYILYGNNKEEKRKYQSALQAMVGGLFRKYKL